MNFEQLADIIANTHLQLQQNAVKAVNQYQTIRNWLIGFYIIEFEQDGEDRAQYGSELLSNLEHRVKQRGLNVTLFQRARSFYVTYPQLSELIRGFASAIQTTPMPKLQERNNSSAIYATVLPKLHSTDNQEKGSKKETIDSQKLISSISFSHFTELIKIADPLKRLYYEMLTIQTGLSVRELKRQIVSLSYERVGLSGDMEKALDSIKQKIHPQTVSDAVKEDYFFEFLNLPQREQDLVKEKELETLLLDNSFNHSHVSQLHSYLNYYKAEMMEPGDNPPIGILLVTNKNDASVQYATSGLDEQVFVSKYQLQLPTEKQLKELILKNIQSK